LDKMRFLESIVSTWPESEAKLLCAMNGVSYEGLREQQRGLELELRWLGETGLSEDENE
jgi:hypothetical protein